MASVTHEHIAYHEVIRMQLVYVGILIHGTQWWNRSLLNVIYATLRYDNPYTIHHTAHPSSVYAMHRQKFTVYAQIFANAAVRPSYTGIYSCSMPWILNIACCMKRRIMRRSSIWVYCFQAVREDMEDNGIPYWVWIVLGILCLIIICLCCCFLIGCVIDRRRYCCINVHIIATLHSSRMITDALSCHIPSGIEGWRNG